MFLKNEDVKIGTIPDANGSDNPLKKMEFLTEKEMKKFYESINNRSIFWNRKRYGKSIGKKRIQFSISCKR